MRRIYIERSAKLRYRQNVLHQAIKHGVVDDLEVLKGNDADFEPIASPMRIEVYLRRMRRIGWTRSAQILDATRIPYGTRLRDLSYAQRLEVAHMVESFRTPYDL